MTFTASWNLAALTIRSLQCNSDEIEFRQGSPKAGKVQLGCGYWQLRSPEVARIYAAAGFNWTFIDTEHGGFDLETVQDICRVANQTSLCPLVRVPDLQYALIARALDCGAQGIVFPRVESPELLKQAISWIKFPPVGIRGYGLTTMHANYEPLGFSGNSRADEPQHDGCDAGGNAVGGGSQG